MKPTWCEKCQHVEPASRKQHPGRWLCMAFKRLDGQGFIAENYWSMNEPFMRCVGINGGDCPLYAEVKADD